MSEANQQPRTTCRARGRYYPEPMHCPRCDACRYELRSIDSGDILEARCWYCAAVLDVSPSRAGASLLAVFVHTTLHDGGPKLLSLAGHIPHR